MAYVVNRDQLAWRVVDDEAVIIHAETSDYFSLNRSGTWLWGLMDVPRTADDLAAALAARYACPRASADADIATYLEHLVVAGLVRRDGHAVPVDAGVARTDGADGYEPPELVRFGSLETLFLSGE